MQEPASKQAFSKARYNISYTGFKALNTILLEENYRNDSTGLWLGYRIFGTDGSTVRLPDSEELEEYKVKVRPGRSYSRDGVGKPKRYHVFRRVC